jgi:protein CpxP
MRSKMLDEQIAMKGKMNNILSAQQYEKWTAIKGKQHKKRRMHQREKTHKRNKKGAIKKNSRN